MNKQTDLRHQHWWRVQAPCNTMTPVASVMQLSTEANAMVAGALAPRLERIQGQMGQMRCLNTEVVQFGAQVQHHYQRMSEVERQLRDHGWEKLRILCCIKCRLLGTTSRTCKTALRHRERSGGHRERLDKWERSTFTRMTTLGLSRENTREENSLTGRSSCGTPGIVRKRKFCSPRGCHWRSKFCAPDLWREVY